MRRLFLSLVLLCLSGIAMAQSGPQFASASFTYERAFCNSYQLSFHGSAAVADTTDAIAEYSWYFGHGDSTYPGKDVTHTYQAPGTYVVWLLVKTVKGDTASTFRYVNVYMDSTSLAARLELHQGPGQANDTLFAFPRYSGTDSIFYTYQWYRDDTLFLTENSGILSSYLRSGTYKVAVTNSLGCSAVSEPLRYLAALDSLNVSFNWTPVNCDSQFIRFHGFVYPEGNDTSAVITQVWNFGDNHGWVGEYPAHRYDSPGVYLVTLTVYVGQDYQRTAQQYVYIPAKSQWSVQIGVATANGKKALTAYTIPPHARVVWNTGDSARTICVTTSGTYAVSVLDDCGQERGTDSIYVSVGDTLYAHHGINANVAKAFPNPSSGLVNLRFARPLLKEIVVSVHNQQGQVLYTRKTRQQSQQLDLSALPKGYYLIVISDGVTRKVQPLILQ